MLKIDSLQSRDVPAWDTFVESMPGMRLYHLSGWARVLRNGYGLADASLVAERDGSVCGVLPLVWAPKIMGGKALVSLPYCDFAGVLADEKETRDALVDAAVRMAEKAGCNLCLRQADAPLEGVPCDEGNVLQRISLAESEDAMMASFSSNLRRKVRKASKNGVALRRGTDQLDAFYAVYSRNMRDLGTPLHAKLFLAAILDEFAERIELVVARHEDIPVGGMLIMRHGDTARDPWTSTLRSHNHLYVSNALYFHAMCYGMERGLSYFDFGRSQPGSGTYKFKQQWGCESLQLYYHDLRGKRQQYKGNAFYESVSSLWRKLPCPVANALGGVLRKYLH